LKLGARKERVVGGGTVWAENIFTGVIIPVDFKILIAVPAVADEFDMGIKMASACYVREAPSELGVGTKYMFFIR